MEEILVHLDQIKENILKQKEEIEEQSKYLNLLCLKIDNKKNTNKKLSGYNINRALILTRPTMIDINKNIKTIDISHKFYLIEESSDNEDGYNEDTKHIMPSLLKVSNNIFDPNLIMVLTDIKYFPKEAEPGLIISGLEDWVTEKHIKYFLKGVPSFQGKSKDESINNSSRFNDSNDIDIKSIKFFVEQNKRYTYIKLNNYNQMKIIGNFFLNPIKKLYPSYNSLKEKIEVYFAYDLLKLTKNHWYGVILRNLPEKCNDKSIYDFTDQKVKNGIKYCLNPICIDNVYCALVVCKELEFAEKLCHELNNTEIKNNYIKAHLHPQICKIRNENFYNNYETIAENGYLFSEDAEQSEKCLSFAKPFMEFFYPDFLNSFNNNKSKKKENKNNNDENIKKNKEKEKNNKREKDLILANSILDLFKKSKSIEELNKTNNQNPKTKTLINNNNIEPSKQNNENILEMQSSEKLLPMNNIKSSIIHQSNENISLEFNQSSSKLLSEVNEVNIINNKNNNNIINNEIKEIPKVNMEIEKQKKEENNNNSIIYSQDEINYYTYNMESQKFYDDLEIQKQRKTNSYRPRNINFKDDYKNYHNSNNFNREYRSQRYDFYKRINSSPPRKQNNSSYKFNRGYSQYYNKDRDYHYNRNYDNYKEKNKERNKEKDRERSRENERERSRDKSEDNERRKFREDRDKRYNNYNNNNQEIKRDKDREWEKEKDKFKDRDKDRDRGYAREKDKEWEKDKEKDREREREREQERERERNYDRDRDRNWDRERRERERDKEIFTDDRNRRNNSYRYNERNDRNERNERNNNFYEKRKDSRHSDSRQNFDRDRRQNDRDRDRDKDRHYNNNYNYNKF